MPTSQPFHRQCDGVFQLTARLLAVLCLGLWTLTVEAGRRTDVDKKIRDKDVHVVRVEEHWKVRVAYPDPANGLPEFLFVLTPTGHFNGQHMVLCMNHLTLPSMQPGGVQLLAFNGAVATAAQHKLAGKLLYIVDDDIEVRMAVNVSVGMLRYEVFQVKGKTWGDNKGVNWLSVSEPTTLLNLDDYDASLTHVWTGAAAGVHTLEKVEVTKVRYVFSDGSTIDVDDYKTKIEYQPAVTYKTYEEYKQSLKTYAQ